MTAVVPLEVAFVGLGIMGGAMARNLIEKGHSLAVYDVFEPSTSPFKELPCRVASSPEDAARDVDFVITMLPNAPEVREVMLGPLGACAAMKPGALLIEMSTSSASGSMALAKELSARGFRMVDAPVGRTPRDALAGTLLIIAGGSKEDVDEARPLFECLGDSIVHAGPQGHGIKLKLVNNYMSTVGTLLTAEALTLANKAGLDRDIVVKVLSATTAGRGQLIVNYPKKVLAGDTSPDFPLRMAHKDVTNALALGAEVSSPLLLGAIAREMFALASPWGRADQDWTAMLLLLEDISRAEHQPAGGASESPFDGRGS